MRFLLSKVADRLAIKWIEAVEFISYKGLGDEFIEWLLAKREEELGAKSQEDK